MQIEGKRMEDDLPGKSTNEKESGVAMLTLEIKASVGIERVHNKRSKSQNKMAILNMLYLTNSRHIKQKWRL